MINCIHPVVEGHGEESAVPVLLRRLLGNFGRYDVEIIRPFRRPRSELVKHDGLQNAVEFTANKIAPNGAILLLIDSDDDCPCILGPELLNIATRHRPDVSIAVVLAQMEFEAWFLAAARSLRAHSRVRDDAVAPQNPAGIRDAKGYFRRNILIPGEYYSPTVDQAAFSAIFDLEEARAASSFDKLYRDVQRLVG